MSDKKSNKPSEQSFEQKLEHSKEILEKLMNPEITLEQSVKLYEEGLANIKEAQKLLESAELKVTTIAQENQESKEG